MANFITADFIIANISGSNDQHDDHDGSTLNVSADRGTHNAAPLYRFATRGPLNLRGRSPDQAYKITVG